MLEVNIIEAGTWAIVAATGLGPIGAIALSFWREDIRAKRERRLEIFRTLMATRKVPISSAHVNALNLIEVDFYKCSGVELAWQAYKAHLDSNPVSEDGPWREEKEKRLAKLLAEIASILNFKIDTLEIFKGGYAPKGWAHQQSRRDTAMEYVNDLYEGRRMVPVRVTSIVSSAPPLITGDRRP